MKRDPTGFAAVPKWIFEAGLGPTAIAVFTCLTAFADDEGLCWPSMSRIAGMLGVTRNTVRSALNDLAEVGAVSWHERTTEGGAQTSHIYRVRFFRQTHKKPVEKSAPTPRPVDNPVCEASEPWSKTDQPPVNDCAAPGQNLPTNKTKRTRPMNEKDTPLPPRRRGTPIPEDWTPTPTHATLAESLGVNTWNAAQAFQADARARGRRLVDWDAGFTAWLHNAPRVKLGEALTPVNAPRSDTALNNIRLALGGANTPTVLDEYSKLNDDGKFWHAYLTAWRKSAALHADAVRADADAAAHVAALMENRRGSSTDKERAA